MPAAVYGRTFARSRSDPRRRGSLRSLRLAGFAVLVIGVFFVVNWAYHVVRKPTELLAPVSPAFAKSPRSTWLAYGHLFREHSTKVISPELLAALAQVEAKGNPIAGTYWRWQWTLNPFEIYRPASSAVGLFQITDATFRGARRLCIHEHTVAREGPWYEPRSCWFNSLYSRVVPSHAVELTAGYLDQAVADTLGPRQLARATRQQTQDLAAVIHLCGPRRGLAFVRRGFSLVPGERCGDHSLRGYVDRVNAMTRQFARIMTD
jgi:hypothetical protein